MDDLQSHTVKSFKKDGDKIYLYEDLDGLSPLVVIPVWMFNQMAETFFNVKIV